MSSQLNYKKVKGTFPQTQYKRTNPLESSKEQGRVIVVETVEKGILPSNTTKLLRQFTLKLPLPHYVLIPLFSKSPSAHPWVLYLKP